MFAKKSSCLTTLISIISRQLPTGQIHLLASREEKKVQVYFKQAKYQLALCRLQSTRMPSANSRLSLPVLLALFCHTQSVEPCLHYGKSAYSLNEKTRCSWNCTVLDSDFAEEMKATIAKKKKCVSIDLRIYCY